METAMTTTIIAAAAGTVVTVVAQVAKNINSVTASYANA